MILRLYSAHILLKVKINYLYFSYTWMLIGMKTLINSFYPGVE